jgi:hypothetical protein
MVFSKILSFLLLGLSIFKFLDNKSESVYYIVNGMLQCHECPTEIGIFLNKHEIIPKMVYKCSSSPLVNRNTKKSLNDKYSGEFEYEDIICDSLIYKKYSKINEFTFIVKISEIDTTIVPYKIIFSGKYSDINTKKLKDKLFD